MREEDSNGLLWFLVGVAVGSAVALLYAPKTGKETRRLISRKTEEGKDFLTDAGRDIYEKGRDLYDKGKEIAEDAADVFERGKRLVRG